MRINAAALRRHQKEWITFVFEMLLVRAAVEPLLEGGFKVRDGHDSAFSALDLVVIVEIKRA